MIPTNPQKARVMSKQDYKWLDEILLEHKAHVEADMDEDPERKEIEAKATLDTAKRHIINHLEKAKPEYAQIKDKNGGWDRMQTLGYHKAIDLYDKNIRGSDES